MKYSFINYADILAIPFFLLSINYFYKIKKRNLQESILFIFSIFGFIFDLFFTIIIFT